MHSITVERKVHDAEQAELRSAAENTLQNQNQSFTKLIGDGQRLFQSLDEEKSLTAKNLENITGGDEYCWLVPEPPLPVGLGGNPAYQGNNYWQLGLRNSGNVVLPTCDLQFTPIETEQEIKAGVVLPQSFSSLSYHFEKVGVLGRPYYLPTPYYIKGDRTYSGVIETPTRKLVEVLEFKPAPNDPTRYIPTCKVATYFGKVLENECNPERPPSPPVRPSSKRSKAH